MDVKSFGAGSVGVLKRKVVVTADGPNTDKLLTTRFFTVRVLPNCAYKLITSIKVINRNIPMIMMTIQRSKCLPQHVSSSTQLQHSSASLCKCLQHPDDQLQPEQEQQ